MLVNGGNLFYRQANPSVCLKNGKNKQYIKKTMEETDHAFGTKMV